MSFFLLGFNDFFKPPWWFHVYLGKKILKTQVVFTKCKKNETTWAPGCALACVPRKKVKKNKWIAGRKIKKKMIESKHVGDILLKNRNTAILF